MSHQVRTPAAIQDAFLCSSPPPTPSQGPGSPPNPPSAASPALGCHFSRGSSKSHCPLPHRPPPCCERSPWMTRAPPPTFSDLPRPRPSHHLPVHWGTLPCSLLHRTVPAEPPPGCPSCLDWHLSGGRHLRSPGLPAALFSCKMTTQVSRLPLSLHKDGGLPSLVSCTPNTQHGV